MRRALVAIGVAVMAFAVVGALTDGGFDPVGVAVFLAAVVIAHDGVLMPLVLAAGALVARFVPAVARPVVQVAGVCSLALGVVAAPLAPGFGRVAGDPSVLPRDYGRGVLLALVAVWSVAGAAVVVRLIGRRRVCKRIERSDGRRV